MPIRDLKAQIARLPEQPGVYLYSNEAGETLYVGKARVLRDRVRSYLGAQGMSPRIDALLDEAQRLEVIVTDSVVEALALENHLIKARGPKYNILLRDDKNYPYLQLTVGEAFPRVLIARSVERDDHFYAGPFLPTKLARRTMSLTHRLFGMRSCNETITGGRGRPCLEYDIKRCIAPCVRELCSEEEYRVAVDHTKLFLEGRSDELVAGLRDRMTEAAAAERFEQAAQLRDAIRTIETQRTRQQKMAGVELGDRDAFGLKLGPAGAVVQIFQMRGGRVIERIELASELGTTFDAGPGALPKTDGESEVLQAALQQFYADRPAPPEVHLPLDFSEADTEMLEGWLTAQAGHRVRLMAPKRGEKRGLLDLAARNAEVAYQARFNENVAAHYDALETLRGVLALAGVPRRIECFDISTIQGAETVASMVVCEDGRMKRSEYRKFRIRGNTTVGSRRSGVGSQSGVGSRQSVVSRESSPGLESSAGSPSPESVVSRESSPGLESSAGSPSPESVGSRESSPGLESSAGSPSPESVGSRESSPGLESSAGSPSPESVGSRESSPGLESSAGSPSPESVGSRESSPGLESSAGSPSPDSGLPSPEPRAPSPESRAPSPESRAPSPESRSPIPDPRVPGSDARFLDDFASMHEVVLRRYRKLLETGGAFPDLVLIDGGKGQLSAAYAALEELGLGSLVAVGIAKKEELLFTRDRDDAIALAHESPALLLIQRIRDEAHRFAVTFHRQQRKTRDLRSELDEIAGIGPRRRKALLTVFGSVAGVRRAARDDLARVIGVKGADAVLSHFNSRT